MFKDIPAPLICSN